MAIKLLSNGEVIAELNGKWSLFEEAVEELFNSLPAPVGFTGTLASPSDTADEGGELSKTDPHFAYDLAKAGGYTVSVDEEIEEKGGATSGHFGHAGRPGQAGGSASVAGYIARTSAMKELGVLHASRMNQFLKYGMPSTVVGGRRYVKWPEAKQWMDEYTKSGKGSVGVTAANARMATLGVPTGTHSKPLPPPPPPSKPISTGEAMSQLGVTHYSRMHSYVKQGMPTTTDPATGKQQIAWPEAKVWYETYEAAGKGRVGIDAANAAMRNVPGIQQQPNAPLTPPKPVSKYHEGDVGEGAEAFFAGSSPEIQALARKTGLVATDADTQRYIESKADTFAKKPSGINQAILNLDETGESSYFGADYTPEVDPRGARIWTQAHPVREAQTGLDGSPVYITQTGKGTLRVLSGRIEDEADRALVERVQARREYHLELLKDRRITAGVPEWEHNSIKRQMANDSAWNELSTADKTKLSSIATRIKRTREIDRAAGDRLKKDYVPVKVEQAPDDRNVNMQMVALEQRNQFLAKPKTFKKPDYKSGEMLALVNPTPSERKAALGRVNSTWDNVNHDGFKANVYRVYKIVPQKTLLDEYQSNVRSKDNEQHNLYHGTHYGVATKVASTGYIVPKEAKAGRMLGDGVYLAKNSSKSVQYAGTSWGRGAARGILLENSAAFGVAKQTTGRYQASRADTTIALASRTALLNDEYCVHYSSKAVLPTLWMDVTRSYK